jgi:hypothetical protein
MYVNVPINHLISIRLSDLDAVDGCCCVGDCAVYVCWKAYRAIDVDGRVTKVHCVVI